MINRIAIKSHAKVNLGLNIIRKRNDGFHDIETIFYPLQLCDILTFEKSNSFQFECDNPDLNKDIENNLVVKTVRLLERASARPMTVSIQLEKTIPMGAGLGGGSSNAAVTLLSLNEMFRLGYTNEQLAKFGLELGSDVPYFLKLRPAFAGSRGEELTYFNAWLKKYIVLINPGIHVATAWAYKSITPCIPANPLSALEYNDNFSFDSLLPLLTNDFEIPVFAEYPEIGKIKSTLLQHGADMALMSGSGSSVFGVFSEETAAENAANACKEYPFVHLERLEEELEN